MRDLHIGELSIEVYRETQGSSRKDKYLVLG